MWTLTRKARRILRATERMTSRLASPCDQIFRATFGHDMLSAPRGPHRGMDKHYVPATWIATNISEFLGISVRNGLGTGCSGEELADWPCSCWRKTHCCAFPCLRLIYYLYTTYILLIYYLHTTYILLIYYILALFQSFMFIHPSFGRPGPSGIYVSESSGSGPPPTGFCQLVSPLHLWPELYHL